MYVTVSVELETKDGRREAACTIGEEDEDREADFKPFILHEVTDTAVTAALTAAGLTQRHAATSTE